MEENEQHQEGLHETEDAQAEDEGGSDRDSGAAVPSACLRPGGGIDPQLEAAEGEEAGDDGDDRNGIAGVHLVGAGDRLEEGREALFGYRRHEQEDGHGGSRQEPGDVPERQEMLTCPGQDGHQEEGQQERPREMDLKRGRQGEAQEEEAAPAVPGLR